VDSILGSSPHPVHLFSDPPFLWFSDGDLIWA
jgi:hypothetical protein